MLRWATRILTALALTAALTTTPAHAAPHSRPGPHHATTYEHPWLFVGDSLTSGWRVTPHDAFPGVFDRAFPNIWTVNAGRNGSCLVAPNCYAWHPWVDEFEHTITPSRPEQIPGRVIVLLGTNDLCKDGGSVEQLQAGYLRLADLADLHGIPITFLTLLPQAPPHHAYCEDDRTAINTWLLTESGLDVVDVATPLADPATGYLRPEYDADDGLHITAAGQRMIAFILGLWAPTVLP